MLSLTYETKNATLVEKSGMVVTRVWGMPDIGGRFCSKGTNFQLDDE